MCRSSKLCSFFVAAITICFLRRNGLFQWPTDGAFSSRANWWFGRSQARSWAQYRHLVDSGCGVHDPLNSFLLGYLIASLLKQLKHSLLTTLPVSLFVGDILADAANHVFKEVENVLISFVSLFLLGGEPLNNLASLLVKCLVHLKCPLLPSYSLLFDLSLQSWNIGPKGIFELLMDL